MRKKCGMYDSSPQGIRFSQIQKNIIWLINKNPSKSIKTSLKLKISYELPTLVKASQTAWPNVFPMASWGCWQNAPREVVESQTLSTCWVSNGSNGLLQKFTYIETWKPKIKMDKMYATSWVSYYVILKKLATLDSCSVSDCWLNTAESCSSCFFFESQSKGTLATWIHTPWIWTEANWSI